MPVSPDFLLISESRNQSLLIKHTKVFLANSVYAKDSINLKSLKCAANSLCSTYNVRSFCIRPLHYLDVYIYIYKPLKNKTTFFRRFACSLSGVTAKVFYS